METALDDYLFWEFLRPTVRGALECSPIDRSRIGGSMGSARELISGFSFEAKMKMAGLFSPFSRRPDMLRVKHWTLEEYPVSHLGTVLPCMGDLPPEEIVKSFVEVADFFRHQAERRLGSTSVRYVRSLSRITDILEAIPIMVIEPRNEQRRPDVMKDQSGEDPPVYPAEGYIEDGNHRALALVFSTPPASLSSAGLVRVTIRVSGLQRLKEGERNVLLRPNHELVRELLL